jgi:hypothetical protein
MARQGYDCVAVDEHVADLERELIELDQELVALRARASSDRHVEAEIQRIGEQTSSILLAAHDKAQETTKAAQAEADRCMADAAANALAITEDANRQLRELEGEMTALKVTRKRLLEDVRGIAGSLTSIADDAGDHFPVVATPVAAGAGAAAIAAQPTEQIEVFDVEAELAREAELDLAGEDEPFRGEEELAGEEESFREEEASREEELSRED